MLVGYVAASSIWSAGGGDGGPAPSGYDTSDPALVFGQASFVVVAQVDRKLGRTPFLGDRMAFEVVVRETLKGTTPTRIMVAQSGSPFGLLYTGFETWPLMRQGETVVIALAPPQPRSRALVVLDGPGGGNLLPVDGRSGDGMAVVAEAEEILERARYPPAIAAQRPADVRRTERFVAAADGFSSPGPASLP